MNLLLPMPAEHLDVELFLLTPEHVSADYVSWLNSPEINRYLESRFTTHSIASTREFVAEKLASPDTLMLGIRSRSLQRHVGNIKLGPIDRHHQTADIGILIGDSAAWGRGIATSAIDLLCTVAREQLGIRKVTAGCYAANGGSRRAFEKAGFALEGVRSEQFLIGGETADLVLMGKVLGRSASSMASTTPS